MEAEVGWYSGEYDGKALGEVGEVGCFLSVYAQCSALFFYLMLNADGPSSSIMQTSISQEFYIWPSVTQAAKNALDIRFVPFSTPRLSSSLFHPHPGTASSTTSTLPSTTLIMTALPLSSLYGSNTPRTPTPTG